MRQIKGMRGRYEVDKRGASRYKAGTIGVRQVQGR